MDDTDRLTLMINALTELAEEEKRAHHTAPMPDLPLLRTVLTDASPLPQEALFLGLAEDGLPVLLNLFDPVPGPILIIGDQASGKTSLLQMVARAVDYLHPPSEVQYGVITQYPGEWHIFQGNQNSAGIYDLQDKNVQELLQSLVTWAHNNKNDGQTILLMIDDLEAMTKLDETNLRWLLLRGPSHRIWPIVTLNASQAETIEAWVSLFRTRLFGHTQKLSDSQFVTGQHNKSLDGLIAGSQFTMPEGTGWLNFWVPIID